MKLLWIAVRRLMADGRPLKTWVTCGPKSRRSWESFQNHVAGLCAQLAAQPKGRWLLSCESTYAFGVGLFALWHSGRIAVLPPNQQGDSLRESARGVHGLICDGDRSLSGLSVLSPLAFSKTESRWKVLNSSRTALELFTSGSTGNRKAVPKTLGQLERELAILEKTFGKELGPCDVYATVSHQHIYGLLFCLLWPLSAGRPFMEKAFLFWEDFVPRGRTGKNLCLVSSPAHLERLSVAGETVLQQNRRSRVFSSGGPLRVSAAERIRATTHHPPVEVFGSTETGGVGWRSGETLWRPLKGVRVSIDTSKQNRLKVKSPFGSSKKWLLMGDRGRVYADGRFEIAGRTDRIVKLAEKRLSLDDMERRLHQHPWIAAARVVLLDSEIEGNRSSLGAVVALNSAGRERLAGAGRSALTLDLRTHLQKSFDASTLPRAFRFVDALPVDAMGKISRAVLMPLFQSEFDASITSPQFLEKKLDTSRLSYRLKVPRRLAYLEGHFPGYPIVPGVVQLQWVVEAATILLGRRPVVRQMDAVKFKTPLLPEQEFSLEIERVVSDSGTLLRFSLFEGKTLYSSGRLVLA